MRRPIPIVTVATWTLSAACAACAAHDVADDSTRAFAPPLAATAAGDRAGGAPATGRPRIDLAERRTAPVVAPTETLGGKAKPPPPPVPPTNLPSPPAPSGRVLQNVATGRCLTI